MRIKAGEVPAATKVYLDVGDGDAKLCQNVIEADDAEGWVDFLDQSKPRIRDEAGRAIDQAPRFRRKGKVTIQMPT